MAEDPPAARLTSADLLACVEETMQVATLRYLTRAGAFAHALQAATGTTLPEPLEAREVMDARLILAWRSPTETLCVTRNASRLAALSARLAAAADGCLVELSGGVRIVRLTGLRIADLLCRLGGTGSVPAPGEARRSRLADVPVLALAVRAGETLLVVDRAYLPHLLAWICETLLDFEAA
jgi:heterotetrameric sarcosine oxidase gamma subunit